ncbi:putative plasma membrane low affinity zinc ion transporter [Cryphonectria parasitica EP155]|uniref:Plasma membrane low affinity zinc ion transporter n=1 Tax=Cryphonectria parasitica (strain ATCC 38755 / EP155) TaxID=660469 RepID=A0A9P4YA18_CRYP1|nr:putative plasma membrane low affinity zinc ion transporter [Cryphonectria parasitica EP155]KAF3769238.1 putative plasma membrane low affinity zinc ion transporter [Cryphonectria parasitica EP155]
MSADSTAMAAPTSVTVECDSGNDYDGRLGLRISSIFVILVGSFIGAVAPIILARSSRMMVPKTAFFIAKYFGSGVIIATAFIHLLAPANEALSSPCFPEDSVIASYSWPEAIALMTIFLMFLIELLASRFEWSLGGAHSHDHSHDLAEAEPVSSIAIKKPADEENVAANDSTTLTLTSVNDPRFTHEVSYPPGGEDHLGHKRDHTEPDSLAAQMTALFILEFGVIFHSVFIGLTLAVAGSEFTILYIVLVFHQSFEGLGLGTRLAVAQWPKGKEWLPYVLGCAYALSTPIAIAIGIGVRQTLAPEGLKSLTINGIFDSISAGILIYTGLVELMAHEFMFNVEMRKSSIGMTLSAFGCMCLGAGLMALLGKWA